MAAPAEPQDLIRTALQKLEEQTGLACRLRRGPIRKGSPEPPDQPQAWIDIQAGPIQATLAAWAMEAVDRAWKLEWFRKDIEAYNAPGFLVTRHLNKDLAATCKNKGLQFLDATGNAFINQPGLFILITGQRPDPLPARRTKTFRGFGPTGLRILYAFTCAPDLVNAPYRDIAKAAGVGLATVAEILADLKQEGFLLTTPDGQRRLLNVPKLREAWTGMFPYKLRGKLKGMKFTAPDPDWWKAAKPKEDGAYWGGEVAAAKLTGYLLPKTCTLYTQQDPKHLIIRHRLRPDPGGTIEILKAFWDPTLPQAPPPHEDIVHPLLVEADLKAIDDPRTLDTARMIHDRYLA